MLHYVHTSLTSHVPYMILDTIISLSSQPAKDVYVLCESMSVTLENYYCMTTVCAIVNYAIIFIVKT